MIRKTNLECYLVRLYRRLLIGRGWTYGGNRCHRDLSGRVNFSAATTYFLNNDEINMHMVAIPGGLPSELVNSNKQGTAHVRGLPLFHIHQLSEVFGQHSHRVSVGSLLFGST